MSRHIPEKIKREVRQKCKFGCIVCGLPIYDYEHILPFSEVKEHSADNIVLLCPNHHALKTRGRYPTAKLLELREAPHNLSKRYTNEVEIGRTRPGQFSAQIGTNTYLYETVDMGVYPLINLEGLNYFSLTRDGEDLLVNAFVPGVDRPRLVINNGELIVSVSNWDFQMVGPKLTLHSSEHQVDFQIVYGSDRVMVEKFRIEGLYGTSVEISSDGVERVSSGTSVKSGIIGNIFHGSCLGIYEHGVYFPSVNRYGYITSESLDEALEGILERILTLNIGENELKLRLFEFTNRLNASIGYDSERRLAVRGKLCDAISKLNNLSLLEQTKSSFNYGNYYRATYNRTDSLDALESAAHWYKKALESAPLDYGGFDLAALQANAAFTSYNLSKNGANSTVLSIDKALQLAKNSLQFYQNLSFDIENRHPGTLVRLETVIAHFSGDGVD